MDKNVLQRYALRCALEDSLIRDASVYLLGEDIGIYGGAFQVSAGLQKKFPGRVIETPISEGGFTGVAIGMSIAGLKPVVEIMFMDFSSQIVDQVLNQAVKYEEMYVGKVKVPMIIRTPAGGYRSYGPTHSQSLENIFASIPNLKIIYPYSCQDYYSLFIDAVESLNRPVMFVENKTLYLKKGMFDRSLVYGPESRVIQEGSEVLILSYGTAIDMSIEAGTVLNTVPTVMDICSLKPFIGLDRIFEQVRRHNFVYITTESPEYASVASYLSYVITLNCFKDLKNPVKIISSKDSVIPFSPRLESKVLISVEQIARELKNAK